MVHRFLIAHKSCCMDLSRAAQGGSLLDYALYLSRQGPALIHIRSRAFPWGHSLGAAAHCATQYMLAWGRVVHGIGVVHGGARNCPTSAQSYGRDGGGCVRDQLWLVNGLVGGRVRVDGRRTCVYLQACVRSEGPPLGSR